MTPFKALILDFLDAWLGLRRRPFRFLLSGLGVGIGVAALVAMLSIGEGAKQTTLKKIASLGTHTIRIESTFSKDSKFSDNRLNLSHGLTQDDAESLRQMVGSGGDVAEYLKKDGVPVASGKFTVGSLIGTRPEWLDAEGVELVMGRPLLHSDLAKQNRVCLLASSLANKLRLQVGDSLLVGSAPFQVVGLTSSKGRLMTEGTGLSTVDFDDLIIVPLSAFPYPRLDQGLSFLDGLVVSIQSELKPNVISLAGQIDELLAKRHNGIADYLVVTPLRLLREAEKTQQVFSLVMGTIASLSLLVGGIGVMNVMLANINEQTREIGLRMAIGASKQRIVSLYLCQSVMLTLLSALWGVAAGATLAQVIQRTAGWEVGYSAASLLIGPIFAVLSGLVFGAHPALRAASISPAAALRDA